MLAGRRHLTYRMWESTKEWWAETGEVNGREKAMSSVQIDYGLQQSLNEISALQTQFDIFRFMRRLVELYGYRYFTILRLPDRTSTRLGENSILTSWPQDYVSSFDKNSLLSTSPLVERLRKRPLAFGFSFEELIAKRPAEVRERAAAVYSDYAAWHGVCLPAVASDGDRAMFMVGGDRAPVQARELADLSLIISHLYQRLTEVSRTPVRAGENVLNERETACLTWTAAGKTSADIAVILSLSEHTVNHYLNRAARKLDTVNRTQAVAKALRQGLIE